MNRLINPNDVDTSDEEVGYNDFVPDDDGWQNFCQPPPPWAEVPPDDDDCPF